MNARYRKKPVVIEAVQFTDDSEETADRVSAFCPVGWFGPSGAFIVPTLEGHVRARIGWWIIRGVQGEFYPCKPDIFEATYEPEAAPLGEAPLPPKEPDECKPPTE